MIKVGIITISDKGSRGEREDISGKVIEEIVKKINGDAYAEIIRSDEGTLINLKPLDPSGIVVVFNEQGVIDHYEQVTEKEKPNVNIPVEKMFHIVNDRVADETHGDSVVDSLIWNLEAQEEARRMYRKKVKNSGIIGIVKAATDNNGKLTEHNATQKRTQVTRSWRTNIRSSPY
ncbi:hypothetical protein LCGC14_2341900 [marine sediment metagenome]|uniref:MoaB/Mog domain-containing protein n=1 Tax=marine sediment metagenome TaxID=412755 RepID=A0A0F9EPI8_9ZZZZ